MRRRHTCTVPPSQCARARSRRAAPCVAQVVEEPNVKLIDELFNEVDDDGGGSLDVAELTAAMRKLQETARANEGELASVAERIAFLQSRAEAWGEVADKTAEAEESEAKLEAVRSNKSISARVGAVLVSPRAPGLVLRPHPLIAC